MAQSHLLVNAELTAEIAHLKDKVADLEQQLADQGKTNDEVQKARELDLQAQVEQYQQTSITRQQMLHKVPGVW